MDDRYAEAMRSLVGEKLDWDYLLDEALRQGMMPLLYWHINASCRDRVPKEAISQLHEGISRERGIEHVSYGRAA